ncbi:MAG: hypothetical protein KA327_07100 [Pseudarcicella sp.]|nr:hypothetical protein [Pseudarcicella sp.]
MHKSSIELQGNIANTLLSDAVFRPMLFSTPMVKALLNGTKTQTRRICPVQPIDNRNWKHSILVETTDKDEKKNVGKIHFCLLKNEFTIAESDDRFFKPVAKVGDIIWVRETYRDIEQDFGNPRYEYKATENINLIDKWKPSLFMQKDACRLWLKVVNVRIEKLHQITDEDARSEGVEYSTEFGYKLYSKNDFFSKHLSASDSYMSLWEKINGEGSWKSNPWVFVYEFEVIDGVPYGFR